MDNTEKLSPQEQALERWRKDGFSEEFLKKCPPVPDDHPIYSRPPGAIFINRPGKPSNDTLPKSDSAPKPDSLP